MGKSATGRESIADSIEEILSKFAKTMVDDRGRIYVPKAFRERLGIKEEGEVYIKLEEDHLQVYTAKFLGREVYTKH